MILYETNIPHVYCIYEGVTINAINIDGNALLEDNTLLDEDCFYTVIDVIDENAHVKKKLIQGIKNQAKKSKPKLFSYLGSSDYADKMLAHSSPKEIRQMIRSAKQASPRFRANINLAKKSLEATADKAAKDGTAAMYDPRNRTIAMDSIRMSMTPKNKRAELIGHEYRHHLQNQALLDRQGIQAVRGNVKNRNKHIVGRDVYNSKGELVKSNDKYYSDPAEYDAYRSQFRAGKGVRRITGFKGFKSMNPTTISKKERMQLVKNPNSGLSKRKIKDSDYHYDFDTPDQTFEKAVHAMGHPKYSKQYSRLHRLNKSSEKIRSRRLKSNLIHTAKQKGMI